MTTKLLLINEYNDLGMDRFWSKVEKTDSCWNWKGSRIQGYGYFRLGKWRRAHRISYEWSKGKIPNGLQIDHLCRNRSCVNPNHMELVTLQENVKRGDSGLWQKLKTHCPQGHEYNKENIGSWGLKRNKRSCKICHKLRERNRKALKKRCLVFQR